MSDTHTDNDTVTVVANDSQKSPRVYKVLLMTLPVGVVIGTIIFMFAYFHMEREDERNHAVIISHGLRVSDLEDMVGKLTDRIGSRDIETEEGRGGLRRAASMIEGGLGPQNVGYPVKRSEGEAAYGRLWKSLYVEIRGEEDPEEVVFAAVSFAGAGEVADANCVSTLMMLASSMAREKSAKTLRFVFLPMDKSPDQQNRWLLDRCLNPGESCVGIIGLQTMKGSPEAGGADWDALAPKDADKAWWSFVSKEGSVGGQKTSSPPSPPSVWVSHAVYSTETWVGERTDRLEPTLDAAREIRTWLLKAAR